MLKEIRDNTIVHVEFHEVAGKAPAELYIRSFSGSPHCCVTEFIFSRGGGLRNILIFNGEGNSSRFDEFKDLDGNGRAEIIGGGKLGAFAYAEDPACTFVLGWDGKRFVDMTRRYPGPVLNDGRWYRDLVLKPSNPRGVSPQTASVGYYASMARIGRGAEARRWLLRYAPKDVRNWVLSNELKSCKSVDYKLSTSQAPVLP